MRGIYVSDAVKQYAVDLVAATRTTPDLRLGASPRATLHLLRAARATAALAGRDHVLPDDVRSSWRGARPPAAAQRRRPAGPPHAVDVLAGVLAHVPVPRSRASA